jgi:hypothetical protein
VNSSLPLRPRPRDCAKRKWWAIAGLPGTDQAWLFGDKPKVVLIAMAARLGKGQHALVDPLPVDIRGFWSYPSQWGSLARRGRQFGWSCIGRPNGIKDALKGLLDQAGVPQR